MTEKFYKHIENTYFSNRVEPYFLDVLQPNLIKLSEGNVEISMRVEDIHTNFHRITHGGVLASLVDLTMGISCMSFNKSVVTTDLSLSYIKNVTKGNTIKAVGKVESNGNKLMRVSCKIYDEKDNLLVSAIGSFFVLGTILENDDLVE